MNLNENNYSFYITLVSDSSSGYFNNKSNYFRTQLPKTIELEKNSWEVALVETILPNEVYNIAREECDFKIVTQNEQLAQMFRDHGTNCQSNSLYTHLSVTFGCGVYHKPAQFVEEINRLINAALKPIIDGTNQNIQFDFGYSGHRKRIKIVTNSLGEHIGLIFKKSLAAKLGLDFEKPVVFSKDNVPHRIDLNAAHNNVYIYSDIVEHSIVGDVLAPLLRVSPYSNGDVIGHREFKVPQYYPVAKTNFDQILVQICGDVGEPVQFVGGKSLVKLHFRKKSRLPIL